MTAGRLMLGLLAATSGVASLVMGPSQRVDILGRMQPASSRMQPACGLRQPPHAQAQEADGGECHSLGEDPGMLCSDDDCIESQIYLCTSPSEDGSTRCTFQEGLSMDGRPVWACAHGDDALTARSRVPQADKDGGASRS